MKTKLFIDFDGTLCDTTKMRDATFEVVKKAGFTREEIVSAYQAECLNYKFTLSSFLARLAKLKKFNMALMNARLDKIYKDMPKYYLYSDAIEFLEKINREQFKVNLLSMGDIEFQKLKIEYSGLGKYFDNLYFTDIQKWDYLANIVGKNEKFIIIDDRADTIQKVAKKYPNALALEINRRSEDKFDPARQADVSSNLQAISLDRVAMYLN